MYMIKLWFKNNNNNTCIEFLACVYVSLANEMLAGSSWEPSIGEWIIIYAQNFAFEILDTLV